MATADHFWIAHPIFLGGCPAPSSRPRPKVAGPTAGRSSDGEAHTRHELDPFAPIRERRDDAVRVADASGSPPDGQSRSSRGGTPDARDGFQIARVIRVSLDAGSVPGRRAMTRSRPVAGQRLPHTPEQPWRKQRSQRPAAALVHRSFWAGQRADYASAAYVSDCAGRRRLIRGYAVRTIGRRSGEERGSTSLLRGRSDLVTLAMNGWATPSRVVAQRPGQSGRHVDLRTPARRPCPCRGPRAASPVGALAGVRRRGPRRLRGSPVPRDRRRDPVAALRGWVGGSRMSGWLGRCDRLIGPAP